MGQFAFLVIRKASGEVVQRWEPPDRFVPSLDIHLGQQFTTADGPYAVVGYQMYDERDLDADVNGVIEVARIDAPSEGCSAAAGREQSSVAGGLTPPSQVPECPQT